ncbi:ABC1 kinase family protein [Salsuginibacillus kocurii]|uniref:ABC1 kinase family protein n=1 Tax=Salsuginibacillus kocurii TaxID=427078 RepID=UPI0003817EDE|nr:AarF/ABC1/UbiB kinase family protein [Salsuginibacillus kocurii]
MSLPKRLATNPGEFDSRSIGVRLRKVMEELGPTFIKLGQMVSTRQDVFPPSIIREIEKLQDDVAPFPYEDAKKQVEEDLDGPVDELFAEFSIEPMAAASIGQVHKAKLKDGTPVAVKVARPNIKEVIEKDLDIIQDLARLLTQRFSWAKYYRLEGIVEEFASAIREESNYTQERYNTGKMKKNMEVFPAVHIPNVYEELSSRRVLTMELIEGKKMSAFLNEEVTAEVDQSKLARTLADSFLHQVLFNGFFHSDPHPGNLYILGKNQVAYIDCGQVGRLNRKMRNQFVDYVIALTKRDPLLVTKAIFEMAYIPKNIDMERFEDDVEYLLDKYYDQPFERVRLGEAINDIFSTAHRYQIFIYQEYTMLAKAIITLEGVCEHLDPHLSIAQAAEPFGRQLAIERYRPRAWFSDFKDEVKEQEETFRSIPKELQGALKRLNESHVGVEMMIPKMGLFLNKLDRISNRISFSITLLSFSIIMVGLIIGSTFGDSSSILVQLPVIEISFIIAFFMFLGLFFAIFKNGRF